MIFGTFTYAVAVLISGSWVNLAAKAGQVTLDEGWAPYCQARVTIATPTSTSIQDALDPRITPRVRIVATNVANSTSRTFSLFVRSRQFDHEMNETSLELAGGEALLQDRANATTSSDITALQYQASVRALVGHVLASIGATLQPGTVDADFTTLTGLTNFIKNPSGEVDTNNWIGTTSISSITRNTLQHWIGVACIAATVSGATPAWSPTASGTDRFSVTPAQSYSFSVYLKSSTSRSAYVAMRFYDSTGTQIGADVNSPAVATSTSAWNRYTVSAIAPAGAVAAWVYIRTTGDANGTVHYCDGAMFTATNGKETDTLTDLAYFDGTTADTSLYNYQWTGTANASTSTRVPVFQRDPDTLSWDPGESAWTFLQPVLTQSGLRLFCDETGKWYLVDSSYLVDGLTIIAEAFNVVRATDTVARDSDEWADSVIVKYSWNDTSNTQQTRYDVASNGAASPKSMLIEYQRPYPGPGAAAYILSKLQGHGRVLDLRAISDLTTSPSKPLSATLPDTPVQTGVTSAVTWDIETDEMIIKSRGLIDTPPDSWLFIPDALTWAGIDAAATWDTWTF
ncbi:hypothetical protein [Leifsonia aquatica]|uniref:hypothetical protein n=1 Tax=Leifsonia aquatica TaxID=144185 RepID=UPI00381C9403